MRRPGPEPSVAPGNIAAVKRIPAGIVAALAVLATGVATTACNVTPTAATVNGDAITVASLNAELAGFGSTAAGQCLLSLNFPRAIDLTGQGTGGAGTYNTTFAVTVLGDSVDGLLAAQYAVSKGIHVDASALAYAKTTWSAQLNGAISAQVQQATSLGGTGGCQKPDGSAFTGVELVAALPPAVREVELANQAIDLVLSSHGTDISDAAVIQYYAANPTQFTKDCVSVIQTADQATATTAYNSLKAGTPFAQVVASATADPAAAAKSGQAGCFSEAAVLSQLQLPSVAVGQAITPFQSNGNWLVYEVSSRTPVPIADVTGDIRLALLQMPANQKRVANEVRKFARGSSVDINPQYGTWTGITIVPPVPPAPKYQLPSYGSTITAPTTTIPSHPTTTAPTTTATG